LFPFRVEVLLWICVLGFELFFDFAELFAESLLFGLKFSSSIFVTLGDQFADLSFDLGVLTARPARHEEANLGVAFPGSELCGVPGGQTIAHADDGLSLGDKFAKGGAKFVGAGFLKLFKEVEKFRVMFGDEVERGLLIFRRNCFRRLWQCLPV
jgi:hypothetical protein